MRRIIAIAGTIVATLAIGMGSASASVGTPHIAAECIPCTSGTISTVNGNQYEVSANNLNVGSEVIQQATGRTMTFGATGSHYGGPAGDNTYTIQFSNGNYMAATDSCQGVVIKASASDNGTVWAWLPAPGNMNTYFINRRCDQPPYGDDEYDETLAADNFNGDQWYIYPINRPGQYTKLAVTP
jgi:hypothetical protein